MSLKVLISLTATQWINLLVILRLIIFAVLSNQYNRIHKAKCHLSGDILTLALAQINTMESNSNYLNLTI